MTAELVTLVRKQAGYEHSELAELLQTDNSTLFLLTFGDSPKTQLLKVCKKSITAELQYQSLCRFHKNMGTGELRVPQPGIYIEEYSAYSMERLEGRSVRECLSRFPTSSERCLTLIQKCGRWLDYFHSLGFDGERQRPELEPKLKYLNEAVDSQACLPDIDRRVLQWLSANRTLAQGESLPCGKLHGDFKPDNLVSSGADLVGIDIESARNGTQLMDAVQFLSNLELLMSQNGVIAWHNRNRQMDEAFIQGYQAYPEIAESVAFRWLRLFHLLHMKQSAQRAKTPLGRWRSYILARRLRHLIS